jgi:hypothetical protein
MADESDILLHEESQEESDNEIQAVKNKGGRPRVEKPPRVYKPRVYDPNKPKKERTEAQKEACLRMIEGRKRSMSERKSVEAIKKELKEKREYELEQKRLDAIEAHEKLLLKKAIVIKKKQIKKEQELEYISDDDTPIHEIKKIMTRPKTKSVGYTKPTITFI